LFRFLANRGWNIRQFRVIGAYLQSPARESQDENFLEYAPPVRDHVACGDPTLLSVLLS